MAVPLLAVEHTGTPLIVLVKCSSELRNGDRRVWRAPLMGLAAQFSFILKICFIWQDRPEKHILSIKLQIYFRHGLFKSYLFLLKKWFKEEWISKNYDLKRNKDIEYLRKNHFIKKRWDLKIKKEKRFSIFVIVAEQQFFFLCTLSCFLKLIFRFIKLKITR